MTISELIIVMAISGTLWGISTVALIKPQQKANIDSIVNTLEADMKSSQTKAMSGQNFVDYGIHFESDRYILFEGNNYDPNGSTNFEVLLEGDIGIEQITLANSNLIFEIGSGETGTVSGSDSLVVRDSNGSDSVQININKYGSISKN